MSDLTTRRMLKAYTQTGASPAMFFAGMFQSPPRNFHNSEEVEIDIIRSNEDVSIVLVDINTDYRWNEASILTNKSYKPPVHKEAITLNSSDLIKRMAGDDPFADPNFRANVIDLAFQGMGEIERKIRRAMEQQASQVMQTGTITLTNAAGVALYTLSYSPKATHFPTVGTTWDNAAADALGDLDASARINRTDGLSNSNEIDFGVDAWNAFLKLDDVQIHYDNRRIELGNIGGFERRGAGGTFQGTVTIGNYHYDCFTYDGQFTDPQSGDGTPYLDPKKVIVRDNRARLDATFGSIPHIGKALGGNRGQLIPELPGRFSNSDGGMDLFINVWLTESGESLKAGIGGRPLFIPTAIDTYSCLTVLS